MASILKLFLSYESISDDIFYYASTAHWGFTEVCFQFFIIDINWTLIHQRIIGKKYANVPRVTGSLVLSKKAGNKALSPFLNYHLPTKTISLSSSSSTISKTEAAQSWCGGSMSHSHETCLHYWQFSTENSINSYLIFYRTISCRF